ncbi:MAG TPA: HEAT repeat domain-containing protein [Spirochaetia bacterium]|nr:HEAT repeat domain-containing protein [Spirochaetia bacterium]
MRQYLSVAAATALLLLYIPVGALAQNGAATTNDKPPTSSSATEDPVTAQWRATLKYGINSEIIDLIGALKDRKNARLNPDLVTTFSQTYDDSVRSAILDLFTALSYDGAENAVRAYLQSKPQNSDLEIASISYLSRTVTHPSKETVSLLESLVGDTTESISNAAIRGLGSIAGNNPPGAYDFGGFEKTLVADLSKNDISTTALGDAILALGDLKSKAAVDPLLAIVTDTTQQASLREYAADSLGKIGDPKAIPALSDLVKDQNAYLRAYGVSALGRFNTPESSEVLSAGLRDSAVGVRLAALDGIARNRLTADAQAVIYKAEHDPDIHVRTRAIQTLGELGTPEAWKTLHAVIEQTGASLDLRTAALDSMVKNDLSGSIDSLKKVIRTEWAATDKHMLYAVGNKLSTTKSSALTDLYALLLTHPDYIVQIYAIRGIALNDITSLRGNVEKLRAESAPPVLKREVDQAVGTLGPAR